VISYRYGLAAESCCCPELLPGKNEISRRSCCRRLFVVEAAHHVASPGGSADLGAKFNMRSNERGSINHDFPIWIAARSCRRIAWRICQSESDERRHASAILIGTIGSFMTNSSLPVAALCPISLNESLVLSISFR
jgi:hypothetical protein